MTDPDTNDVLWTQGLRNQASDIRACSTEAEQEWLEVAESLEVAATEVDRLRAVITEAPHSAECGDRLRVGHSGYPNYLPVKCSCWKAEAL